MILVTGAGGTVGGEVAAALASRGIPFRAAYRTRPARVAPGAEAVFVDYERQDTVRAALAGVEALFLVSNTVAPETQVVQAAKAAGVRRIVKLSVWGAGEEAFTFARWHRPVEREIEKSGLAWTLLRPNGFMQNVPNYMGQTIKAQGALYTSAPEAKISHIDARDIGAAAAQVLVEKGHEGRSYDLSGPAALSYVEIARTLSAILSREVRCVPISDAEYKQGALAAGTPEAYADALVDLNRYYRQGHASRVTPTISTLLGRAPAPFESFARTQLAALGGR